LDQTDKHILAVLEHNARISAAEIGRRIGLSRTAVQDRLTRLETSGVITGYHAHIAPEWDGLVRAVLFVTIAERPCDRALTWLRGLPGVQEVLSLSGDTDALVRCALPDAARLAALNDTVGSSPLIASSTSNLILKTLR
jgi:DNA-binding Lrp family transcriptional regulator